MWVLKEPGAHGGLAEGLLEVVILSQWKGRRACGFVEGKQVECLTQRQLFCGSGCTRMSAPPEPQSFRFLLYFKVLPGLRTVLKPLSSKHFHESNICYSGVPSVPDAHWACCIHCIAREYYSHFDDEEAGFRGAKWSHGISHTCFHRPPSAAFMGSLSLLLQAQETRWSRGVGKALSVQAPFPAADPKGGTGRETG